MTDAELLASYAATGSEGAFGEIVGRYAPMVYSACQRVLGAGPAAEDAAQATFLVLVRKARRLPADTELAGWLYLTARHAAADALKQAARRARHEREAMAMRTRAAGGEPASWNSVRPHLDAALAALPRQQRDAVVLRYLCGLSTEEVAGRLRISAEAAAKRLTRALGWLRERLARNGAVVPAATLGGLLAGNAVEALPAGLAGSIQAVCLGQAAASAGALSITKGVVKAMFWMKVKLAAAVLAGAAVVAGGGGVAVHLAAGEPEKPAAPSPAPAQPNAIDRLKPGEWLEVPDSHLDKVAFEWPKGVVSTQNGIGVKAVIFCWCGGAYDTKRDRLLIWGGGHFAYAGNEIYAFDVNALKWERLNDPSLKTDTDYHAGSEIYEDGTPRSCHSYNYIQYVPSIDRFCSFGTSANFPGSRGGATTWAFDFESKKWEKKAPTAGTGFGSSSAWDPVTGRIWCRLNHSSTLQEWDPVKDVWTTRASRLIDKYWYSHTGALDPLGRRYLGIGAGFVRGYDIGKEGNIVQQDLKTTGPQDIVYAANPGFQYDPVLDKFVGWKGGAEVFTLDPEKLEWEKISPAATNTVTPGKAASYGSYGRFRYIPSKNAYIVVSGVSENVYVYRLTDLSKQPVPKRLAEAAKSADPALAAWAGEQVGRFGSK